MFVVQNRRCQWVLLLTAWLVFPVLADLPPLTHGLTPIAEPADSPTLRLTSMDDEIVDLASLRGQVVVVNFWATWCPPCRREMPSLEHLYQQVGDKGVTVLAVNVGEDEDTVFPFLGTVEPSPTFPILFDTDSSVLTQWRVRGLPTTFVVGPNGKLAYQAVGGREFNHPDLIDQLLQLLEK
ncbi:MAG: TlpA family protein disulfide reductase [Candidatus Thiodiazotropha sp. (ex Myrtea sp. 'scaly one' KF741663)]|nr:TlpA family protein disulfide reductase [Candidatus Thiodiazotropha sp. (ex Myrtea sp. 'scaly one' KF741663)]